MRMVTRIVDLDSPRGWIAVTAGFWALSVAFGVAYSFGAFVEPFSQAWAAGKSEIGWVFSIASFLFLSLGLVTGPLSDRFGPRYLVLAAGFLIGGGLIATG